jgi:DNA polymerase-3 subunit gamma/tau
LVEIFGGLCKAAFTGNSGSMSSQALYRKWRSQTFDEVIGQQHVTETLMNALKLDRVAHAYLFSGPRGTGKTSTARLLAKAVNCLAEAVEDRPCNKCSICVAVNEGRLLDLIEIDAASNTGVDDIRDLRDKVGFRPGEARIKIYIIDEVHMLSKSAFNALLKTLEEPPEHVIFVLATTEPEKIPPTITSRCQRFDFKRIKLADITQRLAFIVSQEGLEAEPAALEYIARQGSGSMRDAISLLDQLTAYSSETITLEVVRNVLGAVASQSVTALVDALLDQNVAGGLDIINQLVGDGVDPRQFAHEIVEYLRSLMLVKLGDGANLLNLPEEMLTTMQSQSAGTESSAIVRATTLFNNALVDIKSGLLDIPQLPLELAFVEAVKPVAMAQKPVAETVSEPTSVSKVSEAKVDILPKSEPPSPIVSKAPVVPAVIETDITVETVRVCIDQVLKDIEKKNKIMAEALRNQTQLYRVSGREIQFITSELMKKRFEKPQPQAAINQAFSEAIGQPVMVRFLPDHIVSTPNNEQADNQDLEALVKTAEDLGGQVVE